MEMKTVFNVPTPETRVSIKGGRVGGDDQLAAEAIVGVKSEADSEEGMVQEDR